MKNRVNPVTGMFIAILVCSSVFAGNPVLSIPGKADRLMVISSGGTESQEIIAACTPSWQPVQNQLTNMNIIAKCYNSDVLSNNPLNAIGAFVGQECRGIGYPIEGMDSIFFLTVTSDLSSGETVTFKMWDSSKCQEYTIAETVPFVSQSEVGSMSEPFLFHSTVACTVDLRTGWNIFSTNCLPAILDMKAIMQTLIDNGSLIKVQDENGNSLEDLGVFGGWKNNIGNISATEGYKIKVTRNCQLQITGSPVALPFDIPLKTGWNIIGYPRQSAANAMAVVQQLIDRKTLVKVQDELGNSIEDYGLFGGWKNYIGNFTPGEGYKVKVSAVENLSVAASYTN
jgi:hypothetical protein